MTEFTYFLMFFRFMLATTENKSSNTYPEENEEDWNDDDEVHIKFCKVASYFYQFKI